MSAKKTGLGRGFSALIPTDLIDESFDPTAGQDEKVSELRQIAIKEIFADPTQPRRHFDEELLAELTQSVKEHGIVQPIVVTIRQEGGYTIVAGERRWRAANSAGLDKMPALVRTLSAQHKLELSLIENLQREQLNIMETATAYAKLHEQFNLTMDDIGKRVGGRSGSTITNTVRLLRLPKEVKQAIAEGKLTEGQARPMINLENDQVMLLLPKILAEQWSARRIEAEVKLLRNQNRNDGDRSKKPKSLRYSGEADKIRKKFNVPVSITASQKDKGSIVISFANKKELERLIDQLAG